MIRGNKLYSWVDVQDWILRYFNVDHSDELNYINIRVYWDGLSIEYANPLTETEIDSLLERIFLIRYSKDSNGTMSISLEGNRALPINLIKVEQSDIEHNSVRPSVARPSIIGPRENRKREVRKSDDFPLIFALHSFKGGVGRTLHAISLALNLSKQQKVLLIDADFEAPGISWLVNAQVSFSDLLLLVHGEGDIDKSIELVAKKLLEDNSGGSNIFALPAFRSLTDQIPSLEVRPEHIYRYNENPFIVTDILIALAKKLSVDYVIIDLRAGVSELSTGWFFDPRINKIFVTTLSSQSILGTSMMFRILSDFEKQNNLRNNDASIPSLIVSQVPKASINEMMLNWGDIYSSDGIMSPIRVSFSESFINTQDYVALEGFEDLTNEQIVGRVIGEVTLFSEEYDGLKSLPSQWEDVVKKIEQTDIVRRLSKLVERFPTKNRETEPVDKQREKLAESTRLLEFAETQKQDAFLKTESIRRLVTSFPVDLPIAVVVGAKGAGKTFLFTQLAYKKDWNLFGKNVVDTYSNVGVILPVTLPANLPNIAEFGVVPESIDELTKSGKRNIWQEFIKPDVEESLKMGLTVTKWREKWLDYISWSAGFKVNEPNVGRDFILFLREHGKKVLAIFDGLEDMFKKFNEDESERKALEALLQDVPNWLETQPERFLGLIVFVRRDIVTAAVAQNTSQFLKKYESFELKWNAEEALRLIHWILNKYVMGSSPTFPDWENTLGEKNRDELVESLHRLWGRKMSKDSSKEAFTHNWVLGSLANLKKEIQSRDVVRFLASASQKTLLANPNTLSQYDDRILIPIAIRESINEVGTKKMEEVKAENQPLKVVLDLLESKKDVLKFPCKGEDIRKHIEEKQITTLEDNGVVVFYNGEYYMAELYRKGLGIDYSRNGRPKVLYF